jgi:hypothetical protein
MPGDVYCHHLQAINCPETPSWSRRWFGPQGDRWWRVLSCAKHLDGLTGLRPFGQLTASDQRFA